MRVFVFGNLNSGKTTLSQQLLQHLPEYKHLSLDDFRRQYSDASLEGEERAIRQFVDAVLSTPNAIVDFTGHGQAATQLQAKLPNTCGIMLIKASSPEQAKANLVIRKYSELPYPSQFTDIESVPETIDRLSEHMDESALMADWQHKVWQSYSVPYNADIRVILRLITLEHHQLIESLKLFANANHEITCLILFGSAGANELRSTSDLDFFVQTSLSPIEVLRLINTSNLINAVHTDILGNKITIRTCSALLLELTCSATLDDISIYYRESCIKRPSSTILKGCEDIRAKLEAVLLTEPTHQQRATDVAAQLFFLFCSLPNLIKVQDTYKYGFHTNIMLHYAIQLESLLANESRHNYLPKQAAQKLPNFPWHVFNISYSEIDPCQYHALHSYLAELYRRLEKQNLIPLDKYFQSQSQCLHELQ
ncbi:MAG: hypothetical protein LPD71_12895 [Shewanella sp.]|nr:hypothetical protein [Shewanella sp.]